MGGSVGASTTASVAARSPALQHELALKKAIEESYLAWLDKMKETQNDLDLKKLRFGKRKLPKNTPGRQRRSSPIQLGDFGDLGEHILDNEVLEDDENTLVVKKLASLIRPRFGKRGLPPMKSITGKGPLSKVLAYVAENLNRVYKMSRLNSDNKLKF